MLGQFVWAVDYIMVQNLLDLSKDQAAWFRGELNSQQRRAGVFEISVQVRHMAGGGLENISRSNRTRALSSCGLGLSFGQHSVLVVWG